MWNKWPQVQKCDGVMKGSNARQNKGRLNEPREFLIRCFLRAVTFVARNCATYRIGQSGACLSHMNTTRHNADTHATRIVLRRPYILITNSSSASPLQLSLQGSHDVACRCLVRKLFYTYCALPSRTSASTHQKESHVRHVYICSTTHCLLCPRFIPQYLLRQENFTCSQAYVGEPCLGL